MVRALLFACLLLAACGPRAAPPDVELPRTGIVGSPAADLPGVVETATISAGGRVGGADVGPDLLRTRGGAEAEAPSLLIRADRRAPWSAVVGLMRRAADPDVGIRRLFFAVLPETGEEEGTFAFFLPSPGPKGARIEEEPTMPHVVRIAPGDAATPPAAVHAVLKERSGSRAVAPVLLIPEAGCPFGAVLGTVDAALRAGSPGVALSASPHEEERSRATGDGVSIRLDGETLGPGPWPEMPTVERTDGVAGMTDWPTGILLPRSADARLPVEQGPRLRRELDRLESGLGDFEDPAADVPSTGLAVLAFLSAGESHRRGPHRTCVKEALISLKRWQGPDGTVHRQPGGWDPGGHAVAAFALAEAYRRTGSPLYKQSAQWAVGRLSSSGLPDRERDRDWAALAFRAAAGADLPVPDDLAAWAEGRLDAPPGPVPETVDPRDWLFGLVRAAGADGEVRAEWARAVRERLVPAQPPADLEGRALRAWLIALAWEQDEG